MMAAIERIFNWLEAAPPMQDWEEQRELFPTRRRAADAPPPRPRIRPNMFARLARFCAGNANVILVVAMFIVAVAISLATFNVRTDFQAPIGVNIDESLGAANTELHREFPAFDRLMFMRVSADTPETAKAAAQYLANTLKKNATVFADVFIPGIGPFYDRFGILYLDESDIDARVRHTSQLRPLFQALAVSPNLAGLSTLVTQVASAVASGRSPQGLEGLFLQLSATVQKLAQGKPQAMNWLAVAGLTVEARNTDWTIIVEPQPSMLLEARKTVEDLITSTQQAQDNVTISASFPPGATKEKPLSSGRQIVVYSALAILFVNLLLAFALQKMRTIILVLTPVVIAIIAGFATASLLTVNVDRLVATFLFAIIPPVAAASYGMASAVTKPREQMGSPVSRVMLAAQETSSLTLVIIAATMAFWLAWIYVDIASLQTLGVIMVVALLAALIAIVFVVPGLFTLLPEQEDEWPSRSAGRGWLAFWRRIRPLFSLLGIATCLFCIVFFSSLRFRTETVTDVSRGVQFLVESEKRAENLASDLKSVPEVGTVRWMGAFMPRDIPQKQSILRGLQGSMDMANAVGTLGPHDLGNDIVTIEMGLRTISDVAGTDEGLAKSAHQLRRSLAALLSNSDRNSPVEVQLEQLIFSGFSDLSRRVDEIAGLPAPVVGDFDPDLRRHFVSEKGFWRVEALPRRIIAENTFVTALQNMTSQPLGPLVTADAELNTLRSSLQMPLGFGLFAALLLTLFYLQKVLDWLVVVAGTLLLLPLYAALAVTTDTAISPLLFSAAITAIATNWAFTLVTLVSRRRLPNSTLTILFPAALLLATILPMLFVQIHEFMEFSRAVTVLIVCLLVYHIIVVQQLASWLRTWKLSRSRLQEGSTVA